MASYRQALLESGQILQWDGTGYAQAGEDNQVWWETHPGDYQKRPLADR